MHALLSKHVPLMVAQKPSHPPVLALTLKPKRVH
jgi:hypothetical protein